MPAGNARGNVLVQAGGSGILDLALSTGDDLKNIRKHFEMNYPLPWWYSTSPPCYRKTQQNEPDAELWAAIKAKISKVRLKGYIQVGTVSSLMSLFSVSKGDDDIRIVYNGNQSGLNDCLRAPWF